jgi:protein-S-isoprenylcysteine O-methyltransferase Ste14
VAPLPFSQPGARIAFFSVVGVWVLLEWRIRLLSVFNRAGNRFDRGSMQIVAATFAAGIVGGLELARRLHASAITDARWPVFVAGLVVMCVGIALRQWAVALLGPYFTVDVRVHRGQTVVERGPYRWVRHPSYAGLILTFIGLGLAFGNWAALAVPAVVPTVGLVVRIKTEERALLEGLGEPYRRFAASRPRLFPGVW